MLPLWWSVRVPLAPSAAYSLMLPTRSYVASSDAQANAPDGNAARLGPTGEGAGVARSRRVQEIHTP